MSLPFIPSSKLVRQKAFATLMSPLEKKFCLNEVNALISKGLIEPSKSPWACHAFVVNKHSEIKRGKPRLMVNYKPLNKFMQLIHYPLPHKSSLIQHIVGKTIFNKFDLKSGFYQIGIIKED